MLSQQFSTSLVFSESPFAFLFKVYIKQIRIWDKLPTSKMALSVTIGIYKVIFCSLMILYTQYCSMSAFSCVSSLPVPFCPRWFHLQTPEMVLFVTITVAKVVFYSAVVLHVQFLPVSFLLFLCQFIAETIQLQVVPSSSSSLQIVPACSRQFQPAPGGPTSFQLIPCFSMYAKTQLVNFYNICCLLIFLNISH